MLTLDLGKQTGWTILNDGIVQSGSKSFHVSRFSGGGMQFLNFRNWLNSLKYKFPGIEVVYFEEVRRHLGTDAAHIYGGFWHTFLLGVKKVIFPIKVFRLRLLNVL